MTEINKDDSPNLPLQLTKMSHDWGTWLLRKEIVARSNRVSERQRQQEEYLTSQKLQHSKRLKQTLSTEVWNARHRDKRRMDEQEDQRLKQRLKDAQIMDNLRKMHIQKRSSEMYGQWLAKKSADSREMKTKLQRESQVLREMEDNKKLRNEKVYRQWLALADSKSRPVSRSYGLSCGKLISWRT